MPIYEYKCASCEQTFEYMQRISEDPKTECERCGASLERLISSTSFQLKGGGWYKDLYSSPKPDSAKSGASNGESKSSESKPDGGSAAKESKPAAKADAGSSKSSS
jgi:putative FmdB family regulatory protein